MSEANGNTISRSESKIAKAALLAFISEQILTDKKRFSDSQINSMIKDAID